MAFLLLQINIETKILQSLLGTKISVNLMNVQIAVGRQVFFYYG